MDPQQPRVLMACPTYEGEKYALKRWAEAYHAQTYANKGALQVDNSNAPAYGGNLNYLHAIRAEGIPAIWQQTRWPAFWDTLEESWRIIVSYANAHGYDFIFSVEADVIVPPDAMEKMVAAAREHGKDGKPAVVTQRYHPRGQGGEGGDDAPTFWWDTLGCSLFPVKTLYESLYLVTAMYEIDVFVVCEKAGHPRYRAGRHGPDLFMPDHLKDPEDAYGENVGSTPANVRYTQRVDSGNRSLMGLTPNSLETPMSQGGPEAKTLPAPPLKGEPAELTVERKPVDIIVPGYTGTDAMPVVDIQGDPDLAKRVMSEDRLRLNLGSDWSQVSGFLSVDFNEAVSPDVVADVRSLPMFATDTVDEVYASHVLEHLTWPDGLAALREWLRVLKPGGMLTVAVPDVEGVYLGYKRGVTWGDHNLPMNETYVQATVFGANLLADEIPEMVKLYGGPGHEHKSFYMRDMLLNRVIAAGYVYAHEVNRCFLRGAAQGETMVQARKPKQGE